MKGTGDRCWRFDGYICRVAAGSQIGVETL